MISELKSPASGLLRAALGFASVVFVLSAPASAADVKVFDTPPSADELRDALGLTKKPGAAVIHNSRSIQIDGPAAPAAAPAAAEREKPRPSQATNSDSDDKPVRHTRPHKPRPAAAPAASNTGSGGKQVAMHIQFDVGSATLRPGSEAFVESIAKILGEEKQYSLTIEGHTDASGAYATNLSLSMARANAVRDLLINKYAIDGGRLTAVGKGPSQPLSGTKPTDPSNRRVQFELKS